ncbi:MAG: hypothetical protein IPO17_09710 [Flavobacteriales bacterium]|nr:hypothetical protein [Flavobacteriales bacterium]
MMTALAYGLLASITWAYVVMVRLLWRRTRDVSIPIGAAILYMWTFLGSWFFIGDAAVGFEGYRIGFTYYYLMEKMFPFVVDAKYLMALTGYGAFSIVLLAVLLVLVPARIAPVQEPVVLSRELLVATGLGLLSVSLWAVWPAVKEAVNSGRPLYLVLHEESGWRMSVHALSDRGAGVVLLLGLAVRAAQERGSGPLREQASFLPVWSYAVSVVLLCSWYSLSGNRHTLFTALVLAMAYLLSAAGRRAIKPALMIGAICSVALLSGGYLRGLAWGPVPTGQVAPAPKPAFTLPSIVHVPRESTSMLRKTGEAVFSNELFCAHFSLFGILSRHVPVDGGISFKYLWYSFQPSDQRPPTAYEHYAKSADLVPGQGYTIHHAAAWFVNGGAVGLVVGGALLGAIWGLLLRWRARAVGPVWITACAALLPLCFVAALPEVIRSGPEAFKALVFEGSLLPLMVLAPAMLFGRRSGRTHNTSRS